MNPNLIDPRLIAPAIEVAVLIAVPIAIFVQKRRRITSRLRDHIEEESDRTFYQHESRAKAEGKLAERQSRIGVH